MGDPQSASPDPVPLRYQFSALESEKVKFSDTRYPALGPELIPVYRQHVTISHHPEVGCHYFSPGLRFTFVSVYQIAEVTYTVSQKKRGQ